MDFIKPYSDENAVKVIAFAINFSQKLELEKVNELISKINSIPYFKEHFPKSDDQTEVSFVFSPEGGQQQTITKNGIVLSNFIGEQLIWSITLNKDIILITCKKYSRWKDISTVAYEHLQKLIDIIEHNVNIAQITLEYLDEFEVLNPTENWKEELFDPTCEYLTPNIYELNDFWHINHGYFISLAGLDDKQLDTININYFSDKDDSLKHKVTIRTQHKLLVEPVKPISDFEYIKDCFEKVHIHSKNTFESIVHNDVLETFNRGERS